MRKLLSCLFLATLSPACATSAVVDDTFVDSGTTQTDTAPSCNSFCNDVCVDLKTDNANCGKCGTACPMGATCVQGTCQCGSGTSKCGATCVDLKTDTSNCGKCGTVCGGDGGAIMGGGTWQCANGTCAIVCPMGKTECSGACVDTKTDKDNCGMCGTTCSQNEQCIDGLCCPMGQLVCNSMCTNVQTDPNHCGMCGKVCPMNMKVCSNGNCISGPIFNSLTGNQQSTTRGAGNSCGTQLSVSQNVTISAIAVNNSLSGNGNMKFMIWTHPGHQLVYVSNPKAFQAGGQAWRQSDSLSYTLQSGQSYDIGAIADVGATWYFDTTPENTPPFQSSSTNPNWSNYASPTSGGHAGADCGIQLY